jgi:cobalt/nickel transport system permease protein
MHIPDGFLDTKTLAVTGALSVGGLAVAMRQVNRILPRNKIPLMGLSAAFVFAAQMLNFPVAGGTSGHLLGGVLAAVLLGPGAAAIVIACVLMVQALLFSDGGVLALGANIFNMAFVGTMVGYAIYRAVQRLLPGLRGRITAVFFAGWCSTVLASLACAGELALSGTLAPGVVFPAMLGVHMLIGIGEGLITALVLAAIARARPELVLPDTAPATIRSYGTVVIYGALLALGLALFASPFASQWPDGLDKTAEALGFKEKVTEPILPAPIPEYAMPGIHWSAMGTAVAGAVGTVVVFVLAWLLARVLVPQVRPEPAADPRPAQ